MSYKRAQERNRRLKKLYDKTKNSYGAGAYYSKRKNRLIPIYLSSPWLKAHCRRQTRRHLKQNIDNLDIKGNNYKKYFDYWWELF